MNLRDAFSRARSRNSRALVCYVMAGDPSLEATEKLVPALVEAGADVIELGLPFSDPIADGPTLQAAAHRAIASGTTVAKVLDLAARLKALDAPLVTMGYFNPIASMGVPEFARAAAQAGVSGAIIPDVPLEETGPLRAAFTAEGLDLVLLCAPTTPPERMAAIARAARGFIYYVSVAGVTGARSLLPTDLAERVRTLRELSGGVPVAVGFGISSGAQAREVGQSADGVVVGSALVTRYFEYGQAAAVELVRELKAALEG